MILRRLLLGLLVGLGGGVGLGGVAPLAAQTPAPPITWAPKYWNPQPSPEDVILPLPCGGAMALRKVNTTVGNNWLADQRLHLGEGSGTDRLAGTADNPAAAAPSSPEDELDEEVLSRAFLQFHHLSYLAGSLTENHDPARRYYLIGKYEVTAGQYRAVMEEACAPPSVADRLPAAGMSWFDAVTFSRRLTEWLLAHSPDSLPQEDSARAFVRLPTEAEWEFAARGGQAVSDAEFMAARFPMAGPLAQYAWYQGPESCNGGIQTIGLLKPNPLEVYDILGNAKEMMLEPFRMVRANRLHGQVGALIYRGGSCETSNTQMTTAWRIEASYFDDAAATARADIMAGFRVVVAAPALVGHGRMAEIRQDWRDQSDFTDPDPAAASASGPVSPSAPDTAALPPAAAPPPGPVARLEAAAQSVPDRDLQQTLITLADSLREEAARRREVEDRAVQANLRAGALVIRQYRDEMGRLVKTQLAKSLNDQTPDSPGAGDRRRAYDESLAVLNERLRLTQGVYATLLTRTALDYPIQTVVDQTGVVSRQLQDMGATAMATFAETFSRQVQTWARSGSGDIDAYLMEVLPEDLRRR